MEALDATSAQDATDALGAMGAMAMDAMDSVDMMLFPKAAQRRRHRPRRLLGGYETRREHRGGSEAGTRDVPGARWLGPQR